MIIDQIEVYDRQKLILYMINYCIDVLAVTSFYFITVVKLVVYIFTGNLERNCMQICL